MSKLVWSSLVRLALAAHALLCSGISAVASRQERGKMNDMQRADFVLAVLSTAKGAEFTPVQLQKLFFLLDQGTTETIGKPYFNFAPYDYGPFDSDVYRCLEELAGSSLLTIDYSSSVRTYRLTSDGQRRGEALLLALPERLRDFASRCSDFVRQLSFTQLVSAIYKAFPEMKVNSVFKAPQ
jgi:uncharacterized protein